MRLNKEIAAERLLVGMFRRKSAANAEGEVCPYCEFVNKPNSSICAQCYYELNKSPRDQGEPVSVEVSNSIFDELMSDEDDSWEEGDALDVVLTLDQDPLEVEQYEVTNFDSEEPEQVGFMESSSPELHETVSYESIDVSAEDVGEEIKDVPKLDFSKRDPFDEVPEPVHQGKGAVFSPNTPSKMDDDLLGHVGGTELPSLPSDDLYENKVDLTAVKAPAPTPAVVLPAIPNINGAMSQMELPKPVATPVSQPAVIEPETVVEEPVSQPQQVESEEIEEDKTVPSLEVEVAPTPSPPPVNDSRIWPWPESEPWDARQVHREVVSALELVKSGKAEEATTIIDTLGPHLTDDNIDLIYHIGMVLKQLGRIEEVKSMLDRAKLAMPDNEHVSSAIAHLGV